VTILEQLKEVLGFQGRKATVARGYDAGSVNRLSLDWTTSPRSIDADIRNGLVPVRQRARDLSQNNDYARRYLNLVRVNVAGPSGFKLQMNVKELRRLDAGKWESVPDDAANDLIESAFNEWSKASTASINGRLTFRGIADQVMRYVARDGEAIVRKYRSNKIPFGFTLQVLDPAFLDETYNDRLPNGHIVKMGVELDVNRRPIAYYFKKSDPILEVYGFSSSGGSREPIPADEILHLFDQEFENQTRGISWLAQSMTRLRMLSGYEEAALVNARISAAKGGFFTSSVEGGGGEFTGESDSSGNVVLSGEPGSMEQLPAGMDFKPWSPEYPTAQHEMFMKSTIRGIAAGLSVSFESLGNNRSDASFSSIRSGAVEERDSWKLIQEWFRENFLEPIFADWLEMSLMSKSINLPIEKFSKFNVPVWVPRRWDWVDPAKDIQAKIAAVQAGLTTATQVAAEQGEDIRDIYRDLASEKALAKSLGLELSIHQVKGTVPPADPPPPDDEPPGGTSGKELGIELDTRIHGNGKH
jgi:lambda family phage portal protein